MTITYRPHHRAKAHRNIDYGEVRIGLRERWERSGPLAAIASLLTFTVEPEGFLYVALTPFAQRGGPTFEIAIANLVRTTRDQLDPIFALTHIAQSCVMRGIFVDLADAFRTDLMASLMPGYRVDLRSPAVSLSRGWGNHRHPARGVCRHVSAPGSFGGHRPWGTASPAGTPGILSTMVLSELGGDPCCRSGRTIPALRP